MFRIQYPWKYKWKHKNLVFIFISTAAAVYVLTTPQLASIIEQSGSLGYLGALIAGFFFSSLFTTPLAAVSLILLGKTHDPLVVGFIGAFGALAADLIIYRAARKSIDNLSEEIAELKLFVERHNPVHINPQSRILHELRIHLAPVIAGLIIASPLPDELAIGILSATHYDKRKMVLLSYIANFTGIVLLAYIGRSVL